MPTARRYTGQRLDAETGLYFYNARYYDPALGRFTQPDTMVPNPGDPQSLNRYTYAGNNPLRYTDPSGHRFIESVGDVKPCGGIECVYPEGHPLAGYLIGTTLADVDRGQAQMKATVAAGVDWIPGVGDAKGVIEVFTGRDIISGENLGHWRWLGIVGLSELRTVRQLRHVDEVYDGVRQASRFLQSEGVPRRYRKQIIESFDIETIRVRIAGTNEFGIRYYDNTNAFAEGRYLFDTFPASRESLAIKPEWNEMTQFRQWQIRPGTTVIEGRAAPQGRYPGGAFQKFVLYLKDFLQ